MYSNFQEHSFSVHHSQNKEKNNTIAQCKQNRIPFTQELRRTIQQ